MREGWDMTSKKDIQELLSITVRETYKQIDPETLERDITEYGMVVTAFEIEGDRVTARRIDPMDLIKFNKCSKSGIFTKQ